MVRPANFGKRFAGQDTRMSHGCARSVLSLGLAVLAIASSGAAGLSRAPSRPWQEAASAPSALIDLTSFLPRSGDVPGWNPKGEALVYRGEDLFTYIDGGADIYNEYGFRQVVVQDYADASQKTVTLEVFEMADAVAAFGMWTFKTSARGSEVALGQGGRLEDYYLNFWKGPVLATVTGFDESPESVGGVCGIAEAVDRKIPGRGEKPSLVSAFPKEWTARGGLKYLRGPLGLRNLSPVFARQAIRFEEGVAGRPADGVLAVVLKGHTPSESKSVLSDAERVFSSNPPFSDYRSGHGRFEARDARGNFIQARLLDDYTVFLITKGPPGGAEKIWDRLRGAFAAPTQ